MNVLNDKINGINFSVTFLKFYVTTLAKYSLNLTLFDLKYKAQVRYSGQSFYTAGHKEMGVSKTSSLSMLLYGRLMN